MPENEKENLLIIAHAFPPSGGAGVRRVLKVVKYLSQWGWNIIVLAPRRGEHFAYPYDPLLLDKIPPTVQVVESFTPEQWMMTKDVAAGGGAHAQTTSTRLVCTAAYRWLYRFVGGLLAVPESAITWLPFAVWRGLNLIHKHRIDVLLATGPPFSTLLIGTALKRLSGKPLVVEFRDAWIAEPARVYESQWRRRFEKKQETWVVRTSNCVVSVTEGVTQDFAQRYSKIVETDKFVTIPNGYDHSDFAVTEENRTNPDLDTAFNIVYTGTLGGVRTPKYFLQAVRKMLTQRPQLRSQLNIHFVGRCGCFVDGSTIEDYVQTYGLEDIVDLVGFVSCEESLWYQRKADLLLLLVGVVPASEAKCYGLSAKVFDYTLAGKPVLAVAEDGATSDYVRASGIGEIVSHRDEIGIITAVERALEDRLHYAPNQEVIARYDYAALMSRLESVLLSCCDT